MQRRNRETRDGSSHRYDRDASGGGSKARQSLQRDMTPGKIGTKAQMLMTNTSLSSMDASNIVNVKNATNGRNIKTPQTSGQVN